MKDTLRFAPVQIRLSEGEGQKVPRRIQIMRTCTLFHPKYKKVNITRQMLSEMKENFDKKVRGIELMVDYSHDSEREAAAWFKNVEIVDDTKLGESQLWAEVDWTPTGEKSVGDKEFAYLSADFNPDYRDNEKPDVKLGAVLLGAGLTNRPVIKNMNPVIQLSENLKESTMKTEEEVAMMETKLGQVQKLMEDLGVESMEDLMSAVAGMKSKNEEMLGEKQLAEKKEKSQRLFSEGKITKAQMEKSITLGEKEFNAFAEMADMNEKGSVVKLSETGHSEVVIEEEEKEKVTESASDKVLRLAEEKQAKEKGLDVGSAISMVLSENAELKKAYRKETGEEE